MPKKLRVATVVVLLGLLFSDARAFAAVESVWSGLILATNSAHPSEPPPQIAPFKNKLENVFGYNQFELIGHHSELMDSASERWLIPSKDFCLRVVSRTRSKMGYTFKLQLFQQKKNLATFEAKLEPQSPLFIRGPMYGRGQLIIILLVK